MGHLHKKLVESLSLLNSASSLYPFIDNCNHKTSNPLPGKEVLDFNSFAKKGELNIAIYDSTEKGKEYAYTYSPNISSEKFVYKYGFFLKNNPNAQCNINVNIAKVHFSKKKSDLCKELKCFDHYFDDFYMQQEMETATLLLNINKKEPAKRLMDAFRLYTFPESRLNRNEIIRRLTSDYWLDYNSEIRAFAMFRDHLLSNLKESILTYVQ